MDIQTVEITKGGVAAETDECFLPSHLPIFLSAANTIVIVDVGCTTLTFELTENRFTLSFDSPIVAISISELDASIDVPGRDGSATPIILRNDAPFSFRARNVFGTEGRYSVEAASRLTPFVIFAMGGDILSFPNADFSLAPNPASPVTILEAFTADTPGGGGRRR